MVLRELQLCAKHLLEPSMNHLALCSHSIFSGKVLLPLFYRRGNQGFEEWGASPGVLSETLHRQPRSFSQPPG